MLLSKGRIFAAPDRPRENRQRFARRLVVVERHGEFVVSQIHAVMADGGEGSECRHELSLRVADREEV
jgi:hypothetical protein